MVNCFALCCFKKYSRPMSRFEQKAEVCEVFGGKGGSLLPLFMQRKRFAVSFTKSRD